MSFVVVEDVTFDPVDVGFFSTWTVMADSAHLAHLIQKTWFLLGSLQDFESITIAKGIFFAPNFTRAISICDITKGISYTGHGVAFIVTPGFITGRICTPKPGVASIILTGFIAV